MAQHDFAFQGIENQYPALSVNRGVLSLGVYRD